MKRILSVRKISFVSKHYSFNKEELLGCLGSEVRPAADGKLDVKVCKLCSKENKSNPDNIWKLRINPDGSYHCFRCSMHGSYFDLKTKLISGSNVYQYVKPGDKEITVINKAVDNVYDSSTPKFLADEKVEKVLPDQIKAFELTKRLFDNFVEDDELSEVSFDDNTLSSSKSMAKRAEEVRNYLSNVRKLSFKVCQKYGVGVDVQNFPADSGGVIEPHTCITFPWIVSSKDQATGINQNTIIRIKYRY